MAKLDLHVMNLTCLLAATLCAAGLAGRNSPDAASNAQGAAQQAQPLRITTRLVQVSVVALDRSDNLVRGLKREDFTLLDDGVPQEIAVFSAEISGAAPAEAAALPPGTFSNRATGPAAATVLLIDGLNTYFLDQKRVKGQITQFLGNLQPNDRIALYALGRTSVWVIHEFTSNAAEILNSLQQIENKSGPKLDGSRGLDEWLRDANMVSAQVPPYITDMRPVNTLRALEAIANHLANIPGRKNLVWISGSFPIAVGERGLTAYAGRLAPNRQSYENEIARSALAINNANVAIYPVDTHGLEGWMPPPPAAWSGPAGRPTAALQGRQTQASLATMNEIAGRTGGRAFYNTNDISGSIRRAMADASAAYVLGYYPTHGKWDGRFHSIVVRVNRPGLHLRHRRGYFANDAAITDAQNRKEILREAAWSSLEATAIGLTARVSRTPGAAQSELTIELNVDPRDVTLVEQDGHLRGGLDFLFLGRGPNAGDQTGTTASIDIDLPDDHRAEFMQRGVAVTRTLNLPGGDTEVRILVRDNASGAVGSVIVPLSRVN